MSLKCILVHAENTVYTYKRGAKEKLIEFKLIMNPSV